MEIEKLEKEKLELNRKIRELKKIQKEEYIRRGKENGK